MKTNHSTHHYGFLLAVVASLSLFAGCACNKGCCGTDDCCDPATTKTNAAYRVTVGKEVVVNRPEIKLDAAPSSEFAAK